MSQIRLYLDEDAMRGALVAALRNSGVDVVTASESKGVFYTALMLGIFTVYIVFLWHKRGVIQE